MIDARTHHDPARAPGLVARATAAAGTQREAAARIGITPRYLQQLARGEKRMSYPLQLALEALASSSTEGKESGGSDADC